MSPSEKSGKEEEFQSRAELRQYLNKHKKKPFQSGKDAIQAVREEE